ncbi:hypothetical protein LTR29_017123 [Friedmanniomyces endolithicus]|nr:hypothetical protein LTS09_017395 [Friedmanniomyces endolithicus]KAK0302086.1 hypothetical protein LTR01_008967 [Friedmanniomyces endolithicus]KAK0823244.1 hypothetical protein LTR73_008667 [Friedmanniomyces endolithicus]KAK0929259.1 hypothetical protein LTR29_017123 [Friedmanniomyces endolithicus]
MPKHNRSKIKWEMSQRIRSPAPSPMIQADEEMSPFSASEEQEVEDSVNSASGTPKDYSQLGQVEAISVDRANTVIHIPLVHPSLSQPMQFLRMRESGRRHGQPQRSNTVDMERKAPVAILSLLSSTVPFPPNLTRSLSMLSPRLATSFAIAQQLSSIHVKSITIRHRRNASGHNVGNAPLTIEPTSLEDVVNAELEESPGSVSSSIISPSDYSGRSRHSPAGSIVGTPGWDPATHGWITSKSVAGTSATTGTEAVDIYFDAKKRSAQQSGSQRERVCACYSCEVIVQAAAVVRQQAERTQGLATRQRVYKDSAERTESQQIGQR